MTKLCTKEERIAAYNQVFGGVGSGENSGKNYDPKRKYRS